jgi:hypothetical protein
MLTEDKFHQSEVELPERPRCGLLELAPAETIDPVVESYKAGVDRTLLIENLKLSPAERANKFLNFMSFLAEIQRSGQKLRNEAHEH